MTKILRGEIDDRIRALRHDTLSVFGIGRERDARSWMSVIRQLVSAGFLSVDVAQYGSLVLTPMAKEVLSGSAHVMFRDDARVMKAPTERRGAKAIRSTGGTRLPTEESVDLFEELRGYRMRLAKAANVPPYVIFHDSTLRAIADEQPQTLEELATIPGIGERKLERYGVGCLEVVKGFVERLSLGRPRSEATQSS